MATIQGVYVALFGRPADPAGLEYFNDQTNNGANLNAIGDLAATAEYQDRFDGLSNTQIITKIYQSLFARAPEAAGLEFFAAALENGTLNINNIAIAILDGAQGTDKTIIDNKLKAANAFTDALNTATERQAYQGDAAAQAGVNFLTPITTNPATVPSAAATDAAIAAIVSQTPGTNPNPGAGVTIALTANPDTVLTSAADPAFKSTDANDTINATDLTLNSGDNLDGGLGTDSLVIDAKAGALNATLGVAGTAATLKGIEVISIDNDTAVSTLNLSKATGVTEVWSTSSAKAVTFSDVSLGTTLGVKGANAEATTFTFKAASVAGNSDAATIKLEAATGNGGITVNSIETLNFAVKGPSSVGAITADTATKVVLTGEGSFNGSFAGSTTLKSIDASGLNGGLTTSVGAAGATVTGSKLVDAITLGAGKDTVVYNAANISTQGAHDQIFAFTTGADADKIDVKAFALTGVQGLTSFTEVGGFVADGTSFAGNAGATSANYVYFDTNNDGIFNSATDLVIEVTTGGFTAADNVVWA